MIRIRFAALVTSIVLPLGGCGGVLTAVAGQIYGYKFDPAANSLSEVVGSPFPGSTPGPSIPSLGH